ncbi:butyrophilin subfamily 2 member A2-like isoform X2 [Notolabrus celidotus]|uniref:butyrophilin subfamily 2 member A2-like isoform X2 n=1 Tax=Notolabrus celidotus TaxID=1203425 RepID=UPI0014900661|nr:butyrophilin subfamily 2 member A2-like isoform X2 [Notolabrus celidotus]
MGALIWHVCVIAALSSLSRAAPVSNSFDVVVGSPVFAPLGPKTTLPCWLNPSESAEAMDIRWFRQTHFDTPVLLYHAKAFDETTQDSSYTGRVSFGLKDAESGGLKTGDVSLELATVTLQDSGNYTCYVSSDRIYDSSSISLIVTKTGTSPLLSAVWKEDKVNVSCESEGWHPEPSLHWSDAQQALTSKNTKYSTDSSGVVSVHSWILVSSSSQVSCSIVLSGAEAKEARMRLEKPPAAESGSSVGGWVVSALLLAVIAVGVGWFCFKKKGKKARSEGDNAEETDRLLQIGVIQPTNHSTASKNYVNVTLDDVDPQILTFKKGKFRDAPGIASAGQKVTCLTATKGTPCFSSGRHYWEVSLGKETVGIKQSWWVGVTSLTKIPRDISPTAANGFWFLSSSPDIAESFQFNHAPNVLLPVNTQLQTIGVYLDYDNGDAAPMEILQREEAGENSSMQNSTPLSNDGS